MVMVMMMALTDLLSAQTPDSLRVNIIRDNLSAEGNVGVFLERPVGTLLTSFSNFFDYKWYEKSNAILTGQNYALENRLIWSISSNRMEKLNWSARTESNVYLDRRTSLGSDLQNHALLGGISYHHPKWGRYDLLAGGRLEERHQHQEVGKTVELLQRGDWADNQQAFNSRVGITQDYFDDWDNYRYELNGIYQRRLADDVRLQSRISWLDKSHQFYTDTSGSTQQRDIQDLNWQNRLEYRVGESSRIVYTLNWKNLESTTANTRIRTDDSDTTTASTSSSLSLQNIVGLHWQVKNIRGGTDFEVTTTQQRYYIDFAQNYYRLSWYAIMPGWISADSSRWDFKLARLKYDTPDTNNYDDRDEFRFNLSSGLVWVDFPYARLELTLVVQLHHLVYLSSSKSGENYWNRTFRLQSLYAWSRGLWRSRLKTNLQANYYDYDYDEFFLSTGQPLRSFMHRSLLLDERLNRRLTYHWSVQCDVSYKWEEDGKLDWDRFLEDVVAERVQQLFMFTTRFERNLWEAWFGYSVKTREVVYLQAGPASAPANWRGQGPVAGFTWNQTRRLGWQASLDYLQVKDGDRLYTIPRFSLQGSLQF